MNSIVREQMNSISHEPWCDPKEHALLLSGFVYEDGDPLDGCLEGIHTETTADGTEVDSWLHQDADGAEAGLVVQSGGLEIDLTATNVRGLQELLERPGSSDALLTTLKRAADLLS